MSAEEQGQLRAVGMSCLLVDTKKLVEHAKAAGLTELSERQFKKLHASYREVIEIGYQANPGLQPHVAGRRPKRTKG